MTVYQLDEQWRTKLMKIVMPNKFDDKDKSRSDGSKAKMQRWYQQTKISEKRHKDKGKINR